MSKHIYAPKVISDPVYGIFDIRPVIQMADTEEFQSLGDKKQLGMAYLVFPAATHTRRAHSLGAYHTTRELTERWLRLGFINQNEATALAGYALYHDIGHPAFSHVTEELCEKDNDGLGYDVMTRLKDVIEACDIDYNLMLDLASHKNPLYLAVHDKNLGMEKLDYLERDGLYTILSRPSGIDYLRNHIYFMNGGIVVDEKVVDNAVEVQSFYLKMYKNVYLRKASVIAQRMLQKMVYLLIKDGVLKPSDLPNLTDSELIGIMHTTKNAIVAALYKYLKRRELFREAIVIRHQDFIDADNRTGKSIAAFGLTNEEIESLVNSPDLHNKNQAALEALEHKIADLAGIPYEEVLAVPVFNSWRFQPKDITIYREGGQFASLRERYPAHFKNMEEIGKAYLAIRICTTEKNRKVLSEPAIAKQIFDLVRGYIK
ncbi:MAG: HD domain-containing protein [bacterium]|nr:HD domain-containing protein [bacterium]